MNRLENVKYVKFNTNFPIASFKFPICIFYLNNLHWKKSLVALIGILIENGQIEIF